MKVAGWLFVYLSWVGATLGTLPPAPLLPTLHPGDFQIQGTWMPPWPMVMVSTVEKAMVSTMDKVMMMSRVEMETVSRVEKGMVNKEGWVGSALLQDMMLVLMLIVVVVVMMLMLLHVVMMLILLYVVLLMMLLYVVLWIL